MEEEKLSIEVVTRRGVQSVSARELHKILSPSERFNRWFEALLKYGFEEKVDFWYVEVSTHQNQYGGEKVITDYQLSLDMAKEICMLQRSEIGRKFRKYFIAVEKEYSLYKQARKDSKEIRRTFTDALKDHGCDKPYYYIAITNNMKKVFDITHKKDEMSLSELTKIKASEYLAEAMLTNENGYYEVNLVCVNASVAVDNALKLENKQKLLA